MIPGFDKLIWEIFGRSVSTWVRSNESTAEVMKKVKVAIKIWRRNLTDCPFTVSSKGFSKCDVFSLNSGFLSGNFSR